MYIYIYVCMYVCVHACIYVCMVLCSAQPAFMGDVLTGPPSVNKYPAEATLIVKSQHIRPPTRQQDGEMSTAWNYGFRNFDASGQRAFTHDWQMSELDGWNIILDVPRLRVRLVKPSYTLQVQSKPVNLVCGPSCPCI